jgi:hypothetical protein
MSGRSHPPHVACRDSANPLSPPGVQAVELADLEFRAGQRSKFVVPAATGHGIEPATRCAETWLSGGAASAIVGEKLSQDVGTISPESLPSVLAFILVDAIKRWVCNHLAARAAAVARIDHR